MSLLIAVIGIMTLMISITGIGEYFPIIPTFGIGCIIFGIINAVLNSYNIKSGRPRHRGENASCVGFLFFALGIASMLAMILAQMGEARNNVEMATTAAVIFFIVAIICWLVGKLS